MTDKRLFPCSPSKLDQWLSCPRRYRFAYLTRPAIPTKPKAHLTLGAAVHNALKDWWQVPLEKRTPESGVSLLGVSWSDDGFRDGAQSASMLERAGEWIRKYLTHIDPSVEPRGVERTVSTTTPHLTLTGRVDRVDQRGEELVVVDYKTGRHRLEPDEAKTSMALAIYVAGARRTFRTPVFDVELHHLPTGEVVTFRHSEESLQRQLSRADAIGAEAAAATAAWNEGEHSQELGDRLFPPSPSAGCGWCDFQAHCAEGLAAATPVEPWEGLPL
jgi:putative RecB family exonuclease